MQVEKFRGFVAAVVAAICVVGGGAAAIFVWIQPATDPPRDVALIFGIIGGLIGAGSTFLFMADSASRASHAAERSFASGSVATTTAPVGLADLTPAPRVGIREATPEPLDDASTPTPGESYPTP